MKTLNRFITVSLLFIGTVSVAAEEISFASDLLKKFAPNSDFINVKGTIEAADIPYIDETSIRRHEFEAVYSLTDPRFMIYFPQKEVKVHEGNNVFSKKSESVRYVFDGQKWTTFEYSDTIRGETSGGRRVKLSNEIPDFLEKYGIFYSGQALFLNYFPFNVNTNGTFTIIDALANNGFPPCEINLQGDKITIKSVFDKVTWRADLKIIDNFPVPVFYQKINNYEEMPYIDTCEFSNPVKVDGLGMTIPSSLKFEEFYKKFNTGFSVEVKISNISVLRDFDFNSLIGPIPVGWIVIDLDKKIFYQQGESKEKILDSLSNF